MLHLYLQAQKVAGLPLQHIAQLQGIFAYALSLQKADLFNITMQTFPCKWLVVGNNAGNVIHILVLIRL